MQLEYNEPPKPILIIQAPILTIVTPIVHLIATPAEPLNLKARHLHEPILTIEALYMYGWLA